MCRLAVAGTCTAELVPAIVQGCPLASSCSGMLPVTVAARICPLGSGGAGALASCPITKGEVMEEETCSEDGLSSRTLGRLQQGPGLEKELLLSLRQQLPAIKRLFPSDLPELGLGAA